MQAWIVKCEGPRQTLRFCFNGLGDDVLDEALNFLKTFKKNKMRFGDADNDWSYSIELFDTITADDLT